MTTRHCTLTMAMLVAAVTFAACRSQTASPASEPAPLNVTSWTDKTELYMEYPPLVTNQTVRFAVHLTRLGDFKALNAGHPSLEFTPAAGGSATTVLPGSPPLRPGAFRVEGAPPAAGKYRWALKVDAPELSDRHDLGDVTVYADQATARAAAEKALCRSVPGSGFALHLQQTRLQ